MEVVGDDTGGSFCGVGVEGGGVGEGGVLVVEVLEGGWLGLEEELEGVGDESEESRLVPVDGDGDEMGDGLDG